MCGIIACVTLPNRPAPPQDTVKSVSPTTPLPDVLHASLNVIKHRGPDGSGKWISEDGHVGLAHCRLSIVDPTPKGAQPFESDDGQIHAVVNGEIYDHDRLRKLCMEQHGYKFYGESDSELALALYKIYGAPKFLEYIRGEFAFVLYDGTNGQDRFIVARDRYGIKPLFWTICDGRLLVAAEMKAFLPFGWKPQWDTQSVVEGGWVGQTGTVFKGVQKLRPGHWIEVTRESGMKIYQYWDTEYRNKTVVDTRTEEEMILGVRERLVEAIRLRMRADVPVGIYLSGGIDSSAVAGIVTKLAREENVRIGSQESTSRVACFNIKFPEESGFDESGIAHRTAEWLGVDMLEEEITEASLAQNFADTIYHIEHHFGDFNTVAKFQLSSLVRRHGFKVVLTGEGADEHFAGYPPHPLDLLREPDLSQPESPLTVNEKQRQQLLDDLEDEVAKTFGNQGVNPMSDDPHVIKEIGKISTPGGLLGMSIIDVYKPWVHQQYNCTGTIRSALAEVYPGTKDKMRKEWHPLHNGLYMWIQTGLANVILTCLGDRTEMAHSVEARTPFLDHIFTRYVNQLPPTTKIHYTRSEEMPGATDQGPFWTQSSSARQSLHEKWILKQAVRPFITPELYERRKHPFLAPNRWTRDGPIERKFRELLTPEAVAEIGFVDYDVVQEAMNSAFGDEADPAAFRRVMVAASFVVLSQTFGVEKAESGVEAAEIAGRL